MFGGEKSQTADKQALELAKQMRTQGFEDEEIRQRTGWQDFGPDRKWKYEIPDNELRIDMSVVPKSRGRGDVPLVPMERAVSHQALKAAYPTLYNNITVGREFDPGGYGRFSPEVGKAGALLLGGQPRGAPIEDPRRVATHELSHAVADFEGHSPGGSPDMFKKKKGEMLPIDKYGRIAGEALARNAADRIDFTPEERRARSWRSTLDVPYDELILPPGYRR